MRKLLFALLACMALVATAVPAGATPPTDALIVVETSLLGGPNPFVASSDGVICDSGSVHDDSANVTGFSPNGFNFHGIKHFTCDDGSGEFWINLQARIDFRKGVTFQWNVLRATGAYADLHGAGSGFGIPGAPCGNPDECVLDVYSGGLHID